MRDVKKAEIKRVLMGRAVLAEDGGLVALPAGALMRTPIGVGDGADIVAVLGVARRARRYATKDSKTRVTAAARKAMQNVGRKLTLNEQPEAIACLIRYILTRPVVLTFDFVNGIPMLTAYTGRGLTGWISMRRAIGAFERGLPDSMVPGDAKPAKPEKPEKKEKKKKDRQEKKKDKASGKDGKGKEPEKAEEKDASKAEEEPKEHPSGEQEPKEGPEETKVSENEG